MVPVVLAAALIVQAPQITNGRVEVRDATTIEREIAAASATAEPSWVAWKVPAVSGRGSSCCWYQNNNVSWSGCGLEPNVRYDTPPAQPTGPVPIEGGTRVIVMARIADGKVERVRSFSDDCPLDAGGRTIRLVSNVSPEASVAWLSSYVSRIVSEEPRSSGYSNVIAAIGSTAGPAADAALDRLAAPSQPSNVRRQAMHWIGSSRGAAGFTRLEAMLARETDPQMRRTMVQAISQTRQPQATPVLLKIAKDDTDATIRGEALFWLAQTAGKIVAGDITRAIENDPDTKVQERAVQALSQLPKDEGVPLLINVARTHKNAKVRERAMFWLGQSKDPRALRFFEEILRK